jgi:GTPase SAR1 family protein
VSASPAQVIDARWRAPRWADFGKDVRKIVAGRPPIGDENVPLELGPLPGDFGKRFPNLTHLYLWQCRGLESLPKLPQSLQCLDVRGCADLRELPELPGSLETLDVGRCGRLERLPQTAPKALRRLYLDGCAKLKPHSLVAFVEQARDLEELDASGTALPALDELSSARLRKLVLRACPKLASLAGIETFPTLEHVDLSGSEAVTDLPGFPPRLRYLVLHGAEGLCRFMGQDIGPYDRGADGEDVARAFLSRKKFGAELAVMAHAKLLLLGDGRVGKTTLAKRLQWEDFDPAARAAPENRRLEPSKNEPFTHKIQFWRWATGLRLPEKERAALEARAQAAGALLPEGFLDGAVRIWDFGGQEIYHATHRIFAAEGSIFLLVWRAATPASGDAPADVTREQWEEWNRQRPLDYWLDYIYSLRPDARVALVCTECPDPDGMPHKPDWRARAKKHAHRELPAFFVDSLDPACGAHREYRRLVDWIREACGAEARRIGILQPRVYGEVSELLDKWLAENSRARERGDLRKHLLVPWSEWEESVRTAHASSRDRALPPRAAGEAPPLDPADVAAITGYLHEAGHLFRIQRGSDRAVLVDQEWATDLIYRLLQPGPEGRLRKKVAHNGGWLYGADLETDAVWSTLDEFSRARLIAYMEECRVLTRIARAERHSLGDDVFLASDRWLLRPFEEVEQLVDAQMNVVPAEAVALDFEGLKLGELEFRALQAHLARAFGTRAVYFRDGLQALDPEKPPGYCLRARFRPVDGDSFSGAIDAVLLGRKGPLERIGVELEALFFSEGSPLARLRPERRPERRPLSREELDPTAAFFGPRRELADAFEIGVSSSGADKEDARALVGALKTAGFKVDWYADPACRSGDRDKVLPFMNQVMRHPAVLLLVSEGYLAPEPETNWYSAWELADAIVALGEGRPNRHGEPVRRAETQTLVVFKEVRAFHFAQFDKLAHALLEKTAEHFHREYANVPAVLADNFDYYERFRALFAAALKPSNWSAFTHSRGSLGAALPFPTSPSGGAPDFRPIIAAVETAVGRKRRA